MDLNKIRYHVVLAGILLWCQQLVGQQAVIGPLGTPADASAALKLEGTLQGFIPPRMDSNQRKAIASPANGLWVYDTQLKALMQYQFGINNWTMLNAVGLGSLWASNGNQGIETTTNFLGTRNNAQLVFRVNGSLSGYLATDRLHLGTGSGAALHNDNTISTQNIGLGQHTLASAEGVRNIAIGNWAARGLQGGFDNIALGTQAMRFAVNPSINIALGNNALYGLDLQTATNNIAVGFQALVYQSGGSNNIAIGQYALGARPNANYIFSGSVAIGDSTHYHIANNQQSVLLGHYAGGSGFNNAGTTAIGYKAAGAQGQNTTTAIGTSALESIRNNASDGDNTAVGRWAMRNCERCQNTTAVGTAILRDHDSSVNNTVVGVRNRYLSKKGNHNTIVGADNMPIKRGEATVALGSRLSQNGAMDAVVDSSVLVGSAIGNGISSLTNIVALGTQHMRINNPDDNIVVLGHRGLGLSSSGTQIISIGNATLNTHVSGSKLIAIGKDVDVESGVISNAAIIGNTASTFTSGSMVFAGGSRFNFGNQTIGPASIFIVGNSSANGNGAYLSNTGNWTNVSDKNLKTDVVAPNIEMLKSKLLSLPITQWRYKNTNELHISPMAQDFKASFGVGVNNTSISTIDPAGIALLLIKALHQEQQQLLDRIEALMAQLDQ